MKKIGKIATEQNFAAISVGKLNELNEYELQLGPDVKIPGKVFCSTALGTTGSEFSFQSFASGTETVSKSTSLGVICIYVATCLCHTFVPQNIFL